MQRKVSDGPERTVKSITIDGKRGRGIPKKMWEKPIRKDLVVAPLERHDLGYEYLELDACM